MKHHLWTPQAKQYEFMSRTEDEVLYGGAAGGGKSDALIIEAVRQVDKGNYRGLILRKTFPQLTDLIDKSRKYYTAAFPKARYNSTEHCWTFPTGAKIYFGSMQRDGDRFNYQGKDYDFIGFDELTQFTYTQYSYMFSRNRATGPGMLVYIRATANPGGIGHGWVKERFITAAPPMTTIYSDIEVDAPDGKKVTQRRSRVFTPANVFDNNALLSNDPGYISALASLPAAEKKALLYGDWDSFSGQVFTEWRDDPAHYDDQRFTHVIRPFPIPAHWPILRGFDFGYAKPFSVGWFAVDERGKMYHIREYYGSTGDPNIGVRMNPGEIAAQIAAIEREDPNLRGKTMLGIADPSIFDESRGQSVAEMMMAKPNFISWIPADNTRIAGKMQYHYRLAFGREGDPMFQVFSTCKNFIRTVPNLVYDQRNVEDVDTTGEDHIYDMCRYVLMEHRMAPRQEPCHSVPREDPLGMEGEETKAKFYRI